MRTTSAHGRASTTSDPASAGAAAGAGDGASVGWPAVDWPPSAGTATGLVALDLFTLWVRIQAPAAAIKTAAASTAYRRPGRSDARDCLDIRA